MYFSHPDDVELFVGGVSEKPSKNGEILGRTFKCLVSEQFRRMKFGDRFFYENDDNYVSFSEGKFSIDNHIFAVGKLSLMLIWYVKSCYG